MNDCTQAKEITEAVAPILIYLVIVNLTVLISCSYVAVKLFQHPHVHIHLRLILLNVILGIMFRTAFTTIRAMLRLRLLVGTYTDPCVFLEEYSFCSAISSITLPAVKVIPITYILITVERGVALFFAHNYERIRCIPLVILVAGATESYSAAVFPTMYLSLPLMCLWRCPEFRPKWGRHPRRVGAVRLETQTVDPNEAMRHVLNVWDMHAPPRKPK
ncbi:unnamed protein product, partial [Mesorhabditis spiculigera]